jgi:hypothetical protein
VVREIELRGDLLACKVIFHLSLSSTSAFTIHGTAKILPLYMP